MQETSVLTINKYHCHQHYCKVQTFVNYCVTISAVILNGLLIPKYIFNYGKQFFL